MKKESCDINSTSILLFQLLLGTALLLIAVFSGTSLQYISLKSGLSVFLLIYTFNVYKSFHDFFWLPGFNICYTVILRG